MSFDDPTEKLARRYDQTARVYQDLWAPVLRIAGRRILRELADLTVRRVVDIGAGVGALWPDLRTHFPHAFVLAVDRSPGMLTLAPHELARAVADARQLPLVSGEVDLALLVFMLFHLGRPEEALGEARRVLASGGTLATVTWGGELESPATRIWTECLDAHGAAASDPTLRARHELVDTAAKMGALLQNAGFFSVRAWEENMICTMDLDHLLRMKPRMGNEKARFDSLGPRAREAFLQEVKSRMEALAPGCFEAVGKVVYAVAR